MCLPCSSFHSGLAQAKEDAEQPDPSRSRGGHKQRRDRRHASSDASEDDDQQKPDFDFEEALVAAGADEPAQSTSRSWAPPSFFERSAYQALTGEGLTVLPPSAGVGLRYHKANRQWHAVTAAGKHYEPSWGSHRSETRALLMALEKLWGEYVEANQADSKASEHLKVLRAKLADTSF